MLRFIIAIVSFAISITAIGSNYQSSYSPSNTNSTPAANTRIQNSTTDTNAPQRSTRTMRAPSTSQSTAPHRTQHGDSENTQRSNTSGSFTSTDSDDTTYYTFTCPDPSELSIVDTDDGPILFYSTYDNYYTLILGGNENTYPSKGFDPNNTSFSEASCFLTTYGLNECWYQTSDGEFFTMNYVLDNIQFDISTFTDNWTKSNSDFYCEDSNPQNCSVSYSMISDIGSFFTCPKPSELTTNDDGNIVAEGKFRLQSVSIEHTQDSIGELAWEKVLFTDEFELISCVYTSGEDSVSLVAIDQATVNYNQVYDPFTLNWEQVDDGSLTSSWKCTSPNTDYPNNPSYCTVLTKE